jgi:hypothetical protein
MSVQKTVKNKKYTWGPTGTPFGILRYKGGMLLFLLLTGSKRLQILKKMAFRQCPEDDIVQILSKKN